MGRSLIQLYALAVCFCTLLCLAVALGVGLYDVVQIAVPDFTLQIVPAWESNEQYVVYYPDKKDLPADELSRLRETSLAAAVLSERRSALQSLVFVAIILVIDIVVFSIHWLIARRREPQLVQP